MVELTEPGPGHAANDLAELPKREWWRLFIDKGLHSLVQCNAENATRFDRESSPGYYNAMTRGLESFVAGAEHGRRQPLTSEDLLAAHTQVTVGTLKRTDEEKFMPMPQQLSGRETTTFA